MKNNVIINIGWLEIRRRRKMKVFLWSCWRKEIEGKLHLISTVGWLLLVNDWIVEVLKILVKNHHRISWNLLVIKSHFVKIKWKRNSKSFCNNMKSFQPKAFLISTMSAPNNCFISINRKKSELSQFPIRKLHSFPIQSTTPTAH